MKTSKKEILSILKMFAGFDGKFDKTSESLGITLDLRSLTLSQAYLAQVLLNSFGLLNFGFDVFLVGKVQSMRLIVKL